MSTFLNMDLTLMRPLRLDDIFVGDFQEALTDLIWNQLMADNKVTTHEALEDMGYASTGDIAPTENFYLSKVSPSTIIYTTSHRTRWDLSKLPFHTL